MTEHRRRVQRREGWTKDEVRGRVVRYSEEGRKQLEREENEVSGYEGEERQKG